MTRKFISSTKTFRGGGGKQVEWLYNKKICHFGLANKGFRGYFDHLLDFKGISIIL